MPDCQFMFKSIFDKAKTLTVTQGITSYLTVESKSQKITGEHRMRKESDVLKISVFQALNACRIAILQGCPWLGRDLAQPLWRLGKFFLIHCLLLFLSVITLSPLGNFYFSGISYQHNFPKIQLGLYNRKSSFLVATLYK